MSTPSERLGRLGIWTGLDHLPADEVLTFSQRVEAEGFDALWIQEGAGREPFALAGRLIGATREVKIGLGIAPIYARDATAARAGARTLAEFSGDRFVMGLGVSHRSSMTARGHRYATPLRDLEEYLDAWDAADYRAPIPEPEPLLILAALRRRALELAAARSDGAFPYLVTPDYVGRARVILDEAAAAAGRQGRPLLVVSLATAPLGDDDSRRRAGHTYVSRFLQRSHYRTNLAEMGFDAGELGDPPGDRLVEALVVLGDRRAVADRIAEMEAAGADHVALIPLGRNGERGDPEALAALSGLS